MAAVEGGQHGYSAPFAVAVTPSDVLDVGNFFTRALYVGGTGDLAVIMAGDGSTVVFKSVPGGLVLPIRVSRVRATGTTATNVVALW